MVIPHITDSMMPLDCCQTVPPLINLATDDLTSKLYFSKKKIYNIYLTEIVKKHWLDMLYEFWEERDTPYLDNFLP